VASTRRRPSPNNCTPCTAADQRSHEHGISLSAIYACQIEQDASSACIWSRVCRTVDLDERARWQWHPCTRLGLCLSARVVKTFPGKGDRSRRRRKRWGRASVMHRRATRQSRHESSLFFFFFFFCERVFLT
jgi:hypothetical protein